MSHRFKVGQRVRFKAGHSSFEIVRLLPALPNGTNQYRIKEVGGGERVVVEDDIAAAAAEARW
ncbi:MAG TPA: hypothetical protein VE420_02375 [Gemmatimonadales bacterium]|nr:hypothetical protein [Gemmatimonadales bacterium]